ncbi:hypothetical protein evm_002830 [Chilo suppressalis]|nr:hypothetical protein evm_002830 [Chilo suppressalis]
MISKILAVITLAAACTGDAAINHHEPHSSVKHAVSSQSFVRHDVPLSYKHTAVHIYSTEKPSNYVHKPGTPAYQMSRPNYQPQEIQYAPVLREQKTQYPSNAHIIQDNTTPPAEKSNLEPKPHSHPELTFVPGYNIEILQTVNKYPGHNAVYRSYPNMKPHEKLNKQHHLKQFVLYDRKPEHLLPELVETTQPAPTFDFVPKQYKTDTSNLYNTVPIITDLNSLVTPQLAALNIQLQGYPPHPKDHKLHLNVARAYNIAKLPAKAPNDMARLKKNTHGKAQALYQIANAKLNNEQKTRLFPVMYKTISQYS